MRHANDHRKLGRSPSHRKALLRNLMNSLVLAERIETTVPKAKELRPLADRLITLGKRGTLHARRRAFAILSSKGATDKLFETLSGRFSSRDGGYTRIVRTGFRPGDGAEMAILEYLPAEEKKAAAKGKKKKKAPARKTAEKAAPAKKGPAAGEKAPKTAKGKGKGADGEKKAKTARAPGKKKPAEGE
ncbi:MAG: 50S ribosomal protein L17 [Deltaproteobacteria bacterium]|nr:MAG: 50S ribosomal protein L17 [Deltaproteobacteria bacterium]